LSIYPRSNLVNASFQPPKKQKYKEKSKKRVPHHIVEGFEQQLHIHVVAFGCVQKAGAGKELKQAHELDG
jgi:hypothetical protein